MLEGVNIGFDLAINDWCRCRANPNGKCLSFIYLRCEAWYLIGILSKNYYRSGKPLALVEGLPTCIDDSEQYTTAASRGFARQLRKRFSLPVHLVDERFIHR